MIQERLRLMGMSCELANVQILTSHPMEIRKTPNISENFIKPYTGPSRYRGGITRSSDKIVQLACCRCENKIKLSQRHRKMILRLGHESCPILTWSEGDIVFEQQLSRKRTQFHPCHWKLVSTTFSNNWS